MAQPSGRASFDVAGLIPELASAWRPAAIVPDAAWNALFSLTVPAATLLLLMAVPRTHLRWMPAVLVAVAGLSGVFAAVQFAGAAPDDPLINERLGYASGLFANRNHQALFLAMGIAAACQWGASRPFSPVRAAVAAAAAAWFVLMLLATGSRAGLALGLVALAGGAALVAGAVRRDAPPAPSLAPRLGSGSGRHARGHRRAQPLRGPFGIAEPPERRRDRRGDARPRAAGGARSGADLLLDRRGTGRVRHPVPAVEPDALLKPTYFNHAHNDYLELVIDAGVPGSAAPAARAGVARRRSAGGRGGARRRARSSGRGWARRDPVDAARQRHRLSARTPLIMALLILAIGWLRARPCRPAALPHEGAILYGRAARRGGQEIRSFPMRSSLTLLAAAGLLLAGCAGKPPLRSSSELTVLDAQQAMPAPARGDLVASDRPR